MKALHLAILSLAVFSLVSIQAFATNNKPKPPTVVNNNNSHGGDANSNSNSNSSANADGGDGLGISSVGNTTANGGSGGAGGNGYGGAGGQGGAVNSSGNASLSASFNYEIPPTSTVAALVANGSSCFGSGSGGFGNSSVNLSFGKTYKDHECNVRENTKVLAGLNNLALANENMCNIDTVLESDAKLPFHYRVCMDNRTQDKTPVPFTDNTGSHWIGTDPVFFNER